MRLVGQTDVRRPVVVKNRQHDRPLHRGRVDARVDSPRRFESTDTQTRVPSGKLTPSSRTTTPF